MTDIKYKKTRFFEIEAARRATSTKRTIVFSYIFLKFEIRNSDMQQIIRQKQNSNPEIRTPEIIRPEKEIRNSNTPQIIPGNGNSKTE